MPIHVQHRALPDLRLCRPIPIHVGLFCELGPRRESPDGTAPGPLRCPVSVVCTTGPSDLVVAGVAEDSQVLHSVLVIETVTDVLLTAMVARARSRLSEEGPLLLSRRLWTTEVRLDAPLGERSLWEPQLPPC